jgi:hypothetical protein
MSAAPRLREVQELFWRLITAPEGVKPALADLARDGRFDPQIVGTLFAGDDAVGAVERLDIYANMYFYRLLDCLREDFPLTAAALGPAGFNDLVTDFLLRHPSRHPSLRELGRPFPDFVAGHAAAAGRSYLPDLARLEWARADLFDAPDAAPAGRADLAGLPAERAGDAVVRLVPAFALLRCRHDVAALWRALDEAPDRSEPGPDGVAIRAAVLRRALGRPTAVRVWRQGFVVFHRRIDEDEARDLEAARAGDTLAALCQRIAAGLTPERATERVGRRLQGWLDDGLIAGFDPPALG